MKPTNSIVLSWSVAVLTSIAVGQQFPSISTQASSQALAVLQHANTANTGSVSINDVTLTGTVHRIAGSDNETGTVTLKATVTGEIRMDLSFPSGPRSETRNKSGQQLLGQWSGPDGVQHAIPSHNLMADSVWFFPPLLLQHLSSSQNLVLSDMGNETIRQSAVEHLRVSRQFSNTPSSVTAVVERATQMDIYLDASTLLPSTLVYNAHHDQDANRDLRVEIRFSDYRPVNGVQVPFEVQKYVNGSLEFDFQFQTVSLNTGVESSDFSIQATDLNLQPRNPK